MTNWRVDPSELGSMSGGQVSKFTAGNITSHRTIYATLNGHEYTWGILKVIPTFNIHGSISYTDKYGIMNHPVGTRGLLLMTP